MSRIGKKTITIPQGVSVVVNGTNVQAKGPKGELFFNLSSGIVLEINENVLSVKCLSDDEFARKMFGTTRAILANMVEGVSKGFQKSLEIHGVGYRAAMRGTGLALSLGFSHEVVYNPIEGVELSMDAEQKNVIHVKGIDKQKVGEVAAQIRGFKEPEPYKGKGIRYVGENIIRKAGKSASK